MQKTSSIVFCLRLIGNGLDHYDTALYGLLAPIIAPLVFHTQDFISSLILAYGLLSLSFITRPLGAYYFSQIKGGPQKGLILSLLGVSISTGLMGCLPSYETAGFLAPLCLMFIRALQGFCASGEMTLCSLLILEHSEKKSMPTKSAWYQSSSVAGILLASLFAHFITKQSNIDWIWRIPFLCGMTTGLIAVLLRIKDKEVYQTTTQKVVFHKVLDKIKNNKFIFLSIIFASAISYITYSVPFVLFNSFVPLVSNISLEDMLFYNSILLVVDMLLLPLLGVFASFFRMEEVLFTSSFVLALCLVPLFLLLKNALLWHVLLIRLFIIILGLLFLAPLHAWFFCQYEGKEKYAVIGLGYAIGSELFGRSVPFVCLSLWKLTQSLIYPSLYLSFLCVCFLLCFYCVIFLKKNKNLDIVLET